MKVDRHGIRFQLWLVFLLFAVMIVGILGVLQTALVQPYYRNSKIQSVQQVSNAITQDLLLNAADEKAVSDALQISVENSVCVQVYNDQDRLVYETDSLGSACAFHAPSKVSSDASLNVRNPKQLKTMLDEQTGSGSVLLTNTQTSQEMIIYGQTVHATLANYYIYVNSPLEPVDSIINFFSQQYFLYMGIVVVVASVVSLILSNTISRPIRAMQAQANKLASADYSASFEGGNYTETKDLATTLNGAAEKLGKINELRKDLIANVSHDIKTPLTSIKAYAEMIRDISGDNPEKRQQHLNVILSEADYMNHLVTDMSELAKLQSGNFILHPANFDIVEKINDLCDYNDAQVKEGGLTVIRDLPNELIVYADEVKITQVINNFFTNAIKHTPPGKTITLRAYRKEDEETARVEVIDEGEGISPEELPYIWDRYQKSSRSFSRSMTSTGLGLSIAKGILDAHHAKFGVISKVNEGSTFWFELQPPQEPEDMEEENEEE
ncbi:MAG: HAMP domain-containing histidine kinase [Galactobacillus timonensis]|uniref:sensor histidine kinase n=1 Tax=Galactobacillus timonensis TaxID=2041840 RepID=UPI0023F0234F|nr:HAMP domain-containing sensor histidine kinase [Galactobacillus timonensis]MCI6068438.1 HAMP domain-containing histidine kinase [Galactobacillus timonensis]MDD7087750.1 HAMP domain-containing sensor histidine kinase [Galactobacillus timonensis]MDY5221835.1 HAMP domain-containing sensor histidine kinase [Lachnospiraceae bacterium]